MTDEENAIITKDRLILATLALEEIRALGRSDDAGRIAAETLESFALADKPDTEARESEVQIEKLLARLEDEREELKDCSRLQGQESALDVMTAQRIANTMYDAMEALAYLTREREADGENK